MAKAKKKYVYFFGNGKAEGKAAMRELLGGKGAGLHEMTRIGVPVPPGFTLTTEVCAHYDARGHTYPKGLEDEVQTALKKIFTNEKMHEVVHTISGFLGIERILCWCPSDPALGSPCPE